VSSSSFQCWLSVGSLCAIAVIAERLAPSQRLITCDNESSYPRYILVTEHPKWRGHSMDDGDTLPE
jgi:hypothetical protein